jgi:hypothetical protein
MAINCDDPNEVLTGAKCFQRCVPPGMHMALQTFLLAVIAGGSLDPDVLMQQAANFKEKIPEGMQADVQNSLLCQILNGVS